MFSGLLETVIGAVWDPDGLIRLNSGSSDGTLWERGSLLQLSWWERGSLTVMGPPAWGGPLRRRLPQESRARGGEGMLGLMTFLNSQTKQTHLFLGFSLQ